MGKGRRPGSTARRPSVRAFLLQAVTVEATNGGNQVVPTLATPTTLEPAAISMGRHGTVPDTHRSVRAIAAVSIT